jgi:tetratricopeptide (TPR) repeat protein
LSSPFLLSFGIVIQAKTVSKTQVYHQADNLFDENKFEELLKFLEDQDSWQDDYELQWRVARAKYQLSKLDTKKKSELVRAAFDNVQRALELSNNNCGPAHKWAAILLNEKAGLEGTKARIEQTLNVRKHMEEAIRLMPNDSTSLYLLGEWHYTISTVSWVEKKMAGVIFAILPDSSLEIALETFQKAEDKNPGFYSKNLVLIARTLMALNREKERAAECLQSVIQKFSASDRWDDKEAVKEAKELLGKLGVKVA